LTWGSLIADQMADDEPPSVPLDEHTEMVDSAWLLHATIWQLLAGSERPASNQRHIPTEKP